MYHYTECGLSNVFLISGFTVEDVPGYGETFTIQDIAGLHDAIGDSIIGQHRTMNGAEFRFLRLELDLSQRALADRLSTNEQSIAKWEKALQKPVANRSAERLLRILYANARTNRKLDRFIDTVTDSDRSLDADQIQLALEPDGWHTAIAA